MADSVPANNSTEASTSSADITGFIYRDAESGKTFRIPSDSIHYQWVEANRALVPEAELAKYFEEHGQPDNGQ